MYFGSSLSYVFLDLIAPTIILSWKGLVRTYYQSWKALHWLQKLLDGGLVEHQHTGGQYFLEFAHRSFFQKYPRSHEKYVIHDLMRDMSKLVSEDECFIVKDTKDLLKIPQNVRHLKVLKGGDVKCSDLLNLSKYRKLRTLLCDLSLKKESKTGNAVMEKWCTELLCMRVMVCSSISKWGLPGSLSNMKHLRYLKILRL